MNVCSTVLVTVGIFAGQLAYAQNEVRTVQTSTNPRPAEVKQINNTPIIYIHKTEQQATSPAAPNTIKPTPPNQQRCIKKCQHQENDTDSKKKELKEPVKSN